MNQTLGKKGEAIACQYLLSLGYEILHKNWRSRNKEIDIIAKDQDTIVIVEVKTRKNLTDGYPHDRIDEKKQYDLITAADDFIRKNEIEMEVRFDVINVIIFPQTQELEHIPNAFSTF